MPIKSGIPKLDDVTKGGFPEGSLTIFWSKPGVENAPFAYQTMIKSLKSGYSIIYLVNNKTPNMVRQDVVNYGWDFKSYEARKKLVFVDAYSKLVNNVSRERLVVSKPKSVDDVFNSVMKAFQSFKGKKMLIVDDLSTIVDLCGEEVMNKFANLKKEFKKINVTTLLLFTEWPYKRGFLDLIRKSADVIVKISAVEEKVILRKYYLIEKGPKAVIGKGIPFEVVEPGGIKVYIPKILVTGPYNAGKSSFVNSASVKSVSVDRVGTTIALDHGHVDYAGFSLDLFGTPGQERFDPILGMLGSQSIGVIIVVDATAPETYPRAKSMLSKTRTAALPFIVAANKYNLPGALSTNEIRQVFDFNKRVRIIPVRAKSSKECNKKGICALNDGDVRKVFDELFDMILQV